MISVIYLIGEWVTASVFLGLAFLVATIGVAGLGWWVLRGDHLNRRFDVGPAEDGTDQH